jgi:hypothetical protein
MIKLSMIFLSIPVVLLQKLLGDELLLFVLLPKLLPIQRKMEDVAFLMTQ